MIFGGEGVCVFVERIYTDSVIFIINIFTNGVDDGILNI